MMQLTAGNSDDLGMCCGMRVLTPFCPRCGAQIANGVGKELLAHCYALMAKSAKQVKRWRDVLARPGNANDERVRRDLERRVARSESTLAKWSRRVEWLTSQLGHTDQEDKQ